MGILDKFRSIADPRGRVVAADMKRLNDVQRGLGDKATSYVLSGDNETVLSTISTKCAGKELEVGYGYVMHKSPAGPRRELLAQASPYDMEFAKRYAEVLSAGCKDLPDSAAGSAKVPRLVRVLFSEALEGLKPHNYTWPPKPVRIKAKGLTLKTAEALVELLGGTVVDLIDVLYHQKGQYGSISGDMYRKAIDVKPLAKQYPSEFIEAARRIHAGSRANLIKELHKFRLADTSEYRDFVIESAGDSSKAVREMAGSILNTFNAKKLEPKAVELLDKGNVTMRAGMVELLVKMGTDRALDILRTHKETEKTARIVAAIDTALTVSNHAQADTGSEDSDSQYQAIDGSIVEIPALQPVPDGEAPQFGDDDKSALLAAIEQENVRIKKRNEENKRQGYKWSSPLLKNSLASQALSLFNAGRPPWGAAKQELNSFLTWGPGKAWARAAMSKLPQRKALLLSASISRTAQGALSPYAQGPFVDVVREFVSGPSGDIRHLEAIEIEVGTETWFGYGSDRVTRKVKHGDLLRSVIEDSYSYMEPQLDNVPQDALWPYLAQNFDVIDEAFGLKPQNEIGLSRVAAIRVLSRLPKTPARYFGQLLEAATGETKSGRAEARTMLADAPDVEQHVMALLNDSRQAVRAGAAEWIAERNDVEAIPNLKARLKKEKSELAKAAILTTLDVLGEDLSGFVGPKALLEEAEVGLKKAKFDKLDWMGLEHLPKVRYHSKRQVPDEVLKWWIFLAVKLKQPGGNALFDIYMERLLPEDAETFSGWVLDGWYNYDTARPTEEDGNVYAKQHAANRFKYMKQWVKDYT